MNSAAIIISTSSNSSIKNQSVGDGVDTLIELLSTATAEQAATILTILNRGMELYKTSAEAPVETAVKVKTAKTVKAPKKEVALPEATEGAPGAEEYRLSASDIDSSVCVGRNLKGGDDKRWKPIVFRESQCGSPLVAGSDLCAKCSKRAEKYAATPKPGDWSGRVTEEPLGWVHMLGTEWALEKKPRFASGSASAGSAPTSSAASVASEEAEDASDSESESVSSQTEMPATSATTSVAASVAVSATSAPAPSEKKAASAAAKAQKEADKAQKLADKEAEKAQKLAAATAAKLAKEAAAAKKLADKEAAAAKKAAKPVKKAEAKVSAAPASASNSASSASASASASETTEVTEVTGELKLIDGTLYMVKTGNVYEYDELSEKAGDFVGRLTTDETIDTEADEVSAAESDSE
jgi:hypothetical protein